MRTTDHELLALAAKALNNPKINLSTIGGCWFRSDQVGHTDAYGNDYPKEWNPLEDDGDAFDLVVSLRLRVQPGKHIGDGCTVETQRPGIAGCTAFYDDKFKQTRQAIVRAAAEIGKSMS